MDNKRLASVAGSALLGAYSSDITDNPLTGLVSTGIAAGIGSLLVLPEGDFKTAANVVTSIKQDTDYIKSRSAVGVTTETEKLLNHYKQMVKQTKLSSQQISDITTILEQNRYFTPDGTKDIKAFVKTLENIDDPKLLKLLTPLIEDHSLSLTNIDDVNGLRLKQSEVTIQGSDKDKIRKLANIFEKQMGNSVEEAMEKAHLIVTRSEGPIHIRDGSVTIGDINDGGKRVTIPITAYDQNNVRYHNAGNGKATSVKGFTPYALDFANEASVTENGFTRKISFNELKKGMAPEMMLKFLGENAPISSMLGNIQSHFAYDSREVGAELFTSGSSFKASSPSFINNSSQVSYDFVRNLDYSGNLKKDKPLRPIQRITEDPNLKSEEAHVREALTYEKDAYKTSLGVSSNNSTRLQSLDMDTLSSMPSLERSSASSGLRDTLPVEQTTSTKSLHALYDTTKRTDILMASAQVVNKLDVTDADAFNYLSVKLNGDSSKMLADGFGMYHQGHDRVFANTSMVDMTIPNGNALISDKNLLNLLQTGNITEALETGGPVHIGNQVLGYNQYGDKIQLPTQYSSGQIEDAFIDKNNAVNLRVKAQYSPMEAQEDVVKFFSPGSKALLTATENEAFLRSTAIGVALNTRAISVDANKNVLVHDKELKKAFGGSLKDWKATEEMLRSSAFLKRFARTDVSMILDASKTGTLDLLGYLDKNKAVEHAAFFKETGVSDLITKSGVDRETAIMSGLLKLENKASDDLRAHFSTKLMNPLMNLSEGKKLGRGQLDVLKNLVDLKVLPEKFFDIYQHGTPDIREHLINKGKKDLTKLINSVTNREEMFHNIDNKSMRRISKLVKASGIVEDYKTGTISTVGTSHRGIASVGAGNKARMSWNAMQQLKMSGFTNEQLQLFGKIDKQMLYELEGYTKEGRIAKNSVNSLIKGNENVFEDIVSGASPEERLKLLKHRLGDFDYDSNYLDYNLSYDKSEMKSLRFGTMSTNRGGKYSFKDTELTKQSDKLKNNILSLDIAYGQARSAQRRKELSAQLDRAIREYADFKKSAFTGNNNLLKNVASLYSDHSSITMAQPIGGDAQRMVEAFERDNKGKYKNIFNKFFVSSEGAEDIFNRLGINAKDVKYEAIKGTTLSTAMYKDKKGNYVPLSAMITREPAQGGLSSNFVDLIVDNSIKGAKNSIFSAQGQYLMTVGMGGDYDQDTYQTLFSKLSKEEYDSMNKTANNARKEYIPYLNDQVDMTPKGGKKAIRSLNSFETMEDLNAYMLSSDYKGKVRKIFSPMATMLAVNYMKAVDMEYGDNPDKKVLGRITTYKAIENLLKSSHIDTDEFRGSSQPIEKLNAARERFIQYGDASAYRQTIKEQLPTVLGFGKNAETDKTITRAVDIIAASEINNATKVAKTPFTPLDLEVNRGYESFEKSLYSVMDNLDMFDTNKGLDAHRSPSQLYHNASDAIVDTFKKNKSLLGIGAAALVGINLLGRSEPSFADSRNNVRQHSSTMLQQRRDIASDQLGIETNPTKAAYIQPKEYTSKAVQVNGEYYPQTSSFDDTYQMAVDSGTSLTDAIFGDTLRTARVDISQF